MNNKVILFNLIILMSLLSCTHKKEESVVSLAAKEQLISTNTSKLGLIKTERRISGQADTTFSASGSGRMNDDKRDALPVSEEKKNVSEDKEIRMFFTDPASVRGYNSFACNFLHAAVKRNRNSNIVVSPLSLEMLLSLVANGVNEEAAAEILNYLHIPSLDSLNSVNQTWLNLCRHTEEPTHLSVSNSLWSREEVEIKEAYKECIRTQYEASFFTLNPDPAKSQDEINLWADKNTQGLIPNFLREPLMPLPMIAIYNACCFKDEWRMPFEEEHTRMSAFKTAKGNVEVPMMRRSHFAGHFNSTNYKAVDLDYTDKIFSMRVVLPNEGCTLGK